MRMTPTLFYIVALSKTEACQTVEFDRGDSVNDDPVSDSCEAKVI